MARLSSQISKGFKDDSGMMPVVDSPKNEMIVRDPENPRALINLLPENVATFIAAMPSNLLDIGEPGLKHIFAQAKFKPSVLDDRIRYMFWKEYDHAQSNVRNMIMVQVYSGICSRDTFYVALQNKHRLAWILCPPVDYMLAAEEALNFGIEQLRDILAREHTTMTGMIDAKSAAIKLEIVKMLDSRVKGAIVQRTQNLNVNVDAKQPSSGVKTAKLEDVDNRIKELEDQLQGLNEGKTSKLPDIEITPGE